VIFQHRPKHHQLGIKIFSLLGCDRIVRVVSGTKYACTADPAVVGDDDELKVTQGSSKSSKRGSVVDGKT
jgi:hypothetical protein